MYNSEIKNLINAFSKLPNLGPASSRRLVLHLLRNKNSVMFPLAAGIKELAEQVTECEICANIDVKSPCYICSDTKRDFRLLCIVEELGDIWALERGLIYSGIYHVLGGTLSAINGIGPADLNLEKIVERIKKYNVQEVIIATNATLDGQVTSHYITQLIKSTGVKISRPACGIPLGGEIDYLDEGTLNAALRSRQTVE